MSSKTTSVYRIYLYIIKRLIGILVVFVNVEAQFVRSIIMSLLLYKKNVNTINNQ